MDDKPDFEEIGTDADAVGSVETRKVQSLGRVDIPDDFLDEIGVEEGNKVIVICEEDQIVVAEATKERVLKNG